MVGLWKCLCSAVTLSGIGTKVQQSQDLNPSPVDLSSVWIHSIALMQGQVSSQNRISCLQNNKLCTNGVHSYFIPRVHQWCWVLDCSCWSLAQLGAVMFTLNSWGQSCSHWTAGCSHVHTEQLHTEQLGAVMFTLNRWVQSCSQWTAWHGDFHTHRVIPHCCLLSLSTSMT